MRIKCSNVKLRLTLNKLLINVGNHNSKDDHYYQFTLCEWRTTNTFLFASSPTASGGKKWFWGQFGFRQISFLALRNRMCLLENDGLPWTYRLSQEKPKRWWTAAFPALILRQPKQPAWDLLRLDSFIESQGEKRSAMAGRWSHLSGWTKGRGSEKGRHHCIRSQPLMLNSV